jgi:hypothetical protein
MGWHRCCFPLKISLCHVGEMARSLLREAPVSLPVASQMSDLAGLLPNEGSAWISRMRPWPH